MGTNKKQTLYNNTFTHGIPDLILENLKRNSILDDFDITTLKNKILHSSYYNEFKHTKLTHEYELEEEIYKCSPVGLDGIVERALVKKKKAKRRKKRNKKSSE